MSKQLNASEIQSDHTLVDVRSPREYDAERVPGARNIPLGDLEAQCGDLTGVENLVLLCATGMRARKAREILEAKGIKACVLEGGIKEWERSGLPVERTAMQGLSMERQVRIIAGTMSAVGGVLAMFVNPWFAVIPTAVGLGLAFAGVTDTCAMAMILAKLPYNSRRNQTCCEM